MTNTPAPTLLWLRRDLRLSDHQALAAAIADGGPVIPVFIRDELVDGMGAAPKWRLGLSIAAFVESLKVKGSHLVLRSGDPAQVLQDLAEETGARSVRWSRAYDPDAIARDTRVKATLTEAGFQAHSHTGHLLFQPWEVEKKTGGFFKVYTPLWRAVAGRDVPATVPAPAHIPAPDHWPASEALGDWQLGHAMQRGASVVAAHVCVGETAAQHRLDDFIDKAVDQYKANRDFPDLPATSRLSENLTYGEISPAQCWHAGHRAFHSGAMGAEHFLKELVWREFAYHLVFHTPHILKENWRDTWDAFPWQGDNPQAERWRRGTTGEPMVDAGLRELYVTGTMHNRVRMLAASYLTKHLMTDWRVGQAWFAETLIDWDPASNAMGWQWVAGCGPDAAPYFRIFNPAGQAEKFDQLGAYRRRFLLGFQGSDEPDARAFFDAVPKSWALEADAPYPAPIVDLGAGRNRALEAYKTHTEAARAAASLEA